jgi:pimeloyl-ACP methyl ester carboxylesterase
MDVPAKRDLSSDPVGHDVTVDGHVVHVTIEGESHQPTLLCVHGIPGSVRDFRYLAPQLLAHGWRVVRIDLPGFGGSTLNPALEQVSPRAKWVLAVMDALHIDRFAVLGHSFGGATALMVAALAGTRVHALALINSAGGRPHRGMALPQWLLCCMGHAMCVPCIGMLIGSLLREIYRRTGLKSSIELTRPRMAAHLLWVGKVDFPAQRQAAATIACPTLIFSAANDPLVQPSIGEEMVSLLSQSTVTHQLFDDGGHYLQRHQTVAIAYWMATHGAPR